MVARLRAWLPWSACLILTLAGCRGVAPSPSPYVRVVPTRPRPTIQTARAHTLKSAQAHSEIKLVSYEQQPEPPKVVKPPEKTPLSDRLELPANLPGRNAPIITLPELKPGNEAARKEAIERHFPTLPSLPDLPKPQQGTDGKPVSLSDLQSTALSFSPLIRQANASIEAARGAALQAGLHPNPKAGYAGDTWNMGSTIGTQGAYVGQLIKTGGKLQLAYSAASLDVENAELNRRKVESDLLTEVRKGYFSVLVAERSVLVARAFATLTAEVYSIQVTRLRVGQAALDDPLQARVLATQARAALLRSHNRYLSAWKQLAASLGRPDLKPLALAGDLDRPVPVFNSNAVLNRVLDNHTKVHSAENSYQKAQLQLRLAQVMPKPDLDLSYKLQYDKTTLPNNAVHSINIGFDLPLWNRNQGGIREAEGRLFSADDERERVQNDLTARIAAAFEKYDNARSLTLMYRDQIVPDQTRAYRNIYRRYDTVPESLNFNDVVTAQQTLAESIRNYVDTLGNLWESVADIANLLQLDDLFDNAQPGSLEHCPVPNIEALHLPTEPEKPMSQPEAAATPATVERAAIIQEDDKTVEMMDTEIARVQFTVREVDETLKKVPFEVRQLCERQRLSFDIVPIKEP